MQSNWWRCGACCDILCTSCHTYLVFPSCCWILILHICPSGPNQIVSELGRIQVDGSLPMIDYQLLHFIVCCSIAFLVVNSGFFINFIAALWVPCQFLPFRKNRKLSINRCPAYAMPDWSSFFTLHPAAAAAAVASKLALFILCSCLTVCPAKGTMRSTQCILQHLNDGHSSSMDWCLLASWLLVMSSSTIYLLYVALSS